MAVVAAAALLTLGVGPSALAAHHKKANGTAALRDVRSAGKLIRRIPKGKFARGQRPVVLAVSRRAVKLSRTHRPCATVQAVDAALSLLSQQSAWSKHSVPRQARKPLSLLGAAERGLLRKAGKRCAVAMRMTRAMKPATGGGHRYAIVPAPGGPDNEQGEGVNLKLPPGKYRAIKHKGGESGLGALSGQLARGPVARTADDSLNFFRNTDTGIPPNQPGEPQEMTAAVGRNIAWETGNSSDGLSLNGGRTFTMYNPSNLLPDNGRGFCCDQQLVYSPQYDLFVWVMQYWCNTGCLTTNSAGKAVCPGANQPNGSNRIRIAVTTPEQLKQDASNPGAAWTYWDLTPQIFGQPANAWFDRSDISVSQYNLQWSVDVLCPTSALLARVSLEQLLERGTINIGYYDEGNTQAMRVAQGSDSTTSYYADNDSVSEAQIWSWAPGSGTLFRHDINHSSVPNLKSTVDGTDGNDWYGRYGIFPGAVDSATVSGNTLYLAQGTGRDVCSANCSSSSPTLQQDFTEPAIYVSRYDVNSWNLVGERWLWNATLAFAWPALETDAAGDVGITFVTSTDNNNAQPVAGFLTPAEQFVYAGSAGKPYSTGDYGFLQPGRTDTSFVFVGRTEQADGNHWYYIEYGHGSPPPVPPPFVEITSPSGLPIPSYQQGASATYAGEAIDSVDGTLSGGSLVWTEDGTEIGTGTTITHVENAVGFHTITLTGTNGEGVSATSSIAVQVRPPPPPPGFPDVSITSPIDGAFYCAGQNTGNGYYAPVQLEASATDTNNPPESLTYSWTDSIDRGAPQQVSTALSPTLDLYYVSPDGETTHDLTLTATNTSNNSTSTSIRINVGNPGCIQ